MLMKKCLISVGLMFALNPLLSFAAAPVEDYSEPAYELEDGGVSLSRPSRHDGQPSIPERLQRLESKVEHLTQTNVTTRVEELQQTIQELRGELEKQAHELEQLTSIQKAFYKDLNNRLGQAKEASQAAASAVETPPVAAPVKASATNTEATASEVDSNAPESNPPPVAAKVKPVVATANVSQAKPAINSVTAAPNMKPTAAVASAPLAGGEQGVYQQGFALLKSKQYDRALTQFKDYLSKYPKGHYAVNAHFWMGEINYLQGKHTAAKKSFETVVKNYPKDTKIPDALLKLAIIATDTGHKQKAEEMLVQIQKQYPGTTAARLAMIRAQELRLSMH